MNKTLYKASFKSNRILMLIISLVLLMYTSIIISMFDPDSSNAMAEMLEMMPKGFGTAFGFDTLATDLTSHIGTYLYGFIFIMFPMIYTIIVANNLIAKHVDKGSMAYILSTPNTRINIALTQAIFLLSTLTIIFIFETAMGIIISQAMFKGLLDVNKFILLNLVTLSVFFAVSGIGFMFSCVFNESRYSIAFVTGIPIAFLVIKMLSGVNADLQWLKYLTIYSFIDINQIFTNSSFITIAIVSCLIIASIFYGIAVTIFNRRSLTI